MQPHYLARARRQRSKRGLKVCVTLSALYIVGYVRIVDQLIEPT